MAVIWNKLQWWSVTLVFVVHMCWGCTPTGKVETEDKIHFSDIFAYGKVIDIYRGGYMYDTLYTVKFEVYCSFKGDALPQFINITRAGRSEDSSHEPGLCFSNNFRKGRVYYIYLAEDLTPKFNEDEEKTTEELADINLFCEVEIVNYPTNLNGKEPVVVCPDPYPDYAGCIRHISTTPAPEPSVVVKTMAPEVKPEKLPADGTSNGTPEKGETGQAVSLEDGDNSGGRALMSLGVTALCLVLAVL